MVLAPVSGQEPTRPNDDPPEVAAPAEPVEEPNEALAEELAEELARAKARIAELEAEVAKLRAELAARTATPPPPAAPATPPPADDDPFASPASIRRTLESDYTRSLAESLPAAGDAGGAAAFRRELERWVAAANRSYRNPVRWSVRTVDREPRGDRLLVTLEPIDPKTGDSLGDAFPVLLESRLARRWASTARTSPSDATWTLVGTFVPEIRANPARMARGDFDNPPLIGPGAELFWRIEAESLTPARRERPAEPAAPAAPTPPAAPAAPNP
jgi:uncharacterized small protein (DUF1192 family)